MCAYVLMGVCVYVCVSVCIYIHTYLWCMCIIHTNIKPYHALLQDKCGEGGTPYRHGYIVATVATVPALAAAAAAQHLVL